ncbi:MAG: FMN-binding protein [Desulfuromonadaceae bacterium]|nr:FMN-binding protein [Desulfuromonadaceae bacterium]MDD2855234.1 FMN-binding protein [Desulfuromonadaceae bacterium]
MRDTLKLGLVLMTIAGIAGVGVGYVNTLAAPLIEKQILEEKISSFKEVYPAGEKVEDETAKYLTTPDPIIKEVNISYRSGVPAAVIYLVQSKGYSGLITMLAGFDLSSSRITAVKILSQTETPGLGAKSKDPLFQNRFRDKASDVELEVTKAPPSKENQIQAITASTITSKAVTRGVNAAREHFISTFTNRKRNEKHGMTKAGQPVK